MFHDNPDKIGYDSIQDFQSRFVGQSPDKLKKQLDNVVCSPNPFELAQDVTDKENQEPVESKICVDDNLFYSLTGEAQFLPWSESVNADFGQQNAISNDILAQLLNDRNSNSATNQPNFVVIDCRFDYDHQGGQISGAINLNTKDAVQEYFFGDSQRI